MGAADADIMTTLEAPPLEPETQSGDPRWVRPSVAALLIATGVLYLWGLGAQGWANDFYSAAVQAGTKSWKAFFFGSSDSANFITVDKPPASLWVMELSARIFGVNSWSILVRKLVPRADVLPAANSECRRSSFWNCA